MVCKWIDWYKKVTRISFVFAGIIRLQLDELENKASDILCVYEADHCSSVHSFALAGG